MRRLFIEAYLGICLIMVGGIFRSFFSQSYRVSQTTAVWSLSRKVHLNMRL